MPVLTGFVKEIKSRNGVSAKGKPWTMYTLALTDANGADAGFHSAGFDVPVCKQGDYVQFENNVNAKGYSDVVKGTIKVAANPPARAAAPVSKPAANGAVAPAPSLVQSQIQYQNARSAAIALVEVLLGHKALVVSAAATKAGEAKRYEEIVAAVDTLTVKNYFDCETLRLLESVDDVGDVAILASDDIQEEAPEEIEEASDDPGFA